MSHQGVSLHRIALISSFNQASYWAEFQRGEGRVVHQLDGKGWHAVCIEQKIPGGTYFLLPYGPIAESKRAMHEALGQIKALARHHKAWWIRFEPRITEYFVPQSGMVRAPRLVNPEHTLIVDLRPSTEDLRRGLSSTTRNLVNQADKKGLVYWTSANPKDIAQYLQMQMGVSQRTGAKFHPDSYLRRQAELLMPLGVMFLEFAGPKKGEPLACAIVHDYEGVTTYTRAASYPEARELSAGNVLVFKAMLNAKGRGSHSFDLYGIAGPEAGTDDPWYGFSFFKKKYGGQEVAFAGTWDWPLSPLYWPFRWQASFRHFIRHSQQKRLKKQ